MLLTPFERFLRMSPDLEDDALLRRLGNYSEPNIKIVRIEKTSEPLGATVRNEDDAVVVGRIMRGGTAEASGLLHEGDEVLEVSRRAYLFSNLIKAQTVLIWC